MTTHELSERLESLLQRQREAFADVYTIDEDGLPRFVKHDQPETETRDSYSREQFPDDSY